jgi:hypothetical protein
LFFARNGSKIVWRGSFGDRISADLILRLWSRVAEITTVEANSILALPEKRIVPYTGHRDLTLNIFLFGRLADYDWSGRIPKTCDSAGVPPFGDGVTPDFSTIPVAWRPENIGAPFGMSAAVWNRPASMGGQGLTWFWATENDDSQVIRVPRSVIVNVGPGFGTAFGQSSGLGLADAVASLAAELAANRIDVMTHALGTGLFELVPPLPTVGGTPVMYGGSQFGVDRVVEVDSWVGGEVLFLYLLNAFEGSGYVNYVTGHSSLVPAMVAADQALLTSAYPLFGRYGHQIVMFNVDGAQQADEFSTTTRSSMGAITAGLPFVGVSDLGLTSNPALFVGLISDFFGL